MRKCSGVKTDLAFIYLISIAHNVLLENAPEGRYLGHRSHEAQRMETSEKHLDPEFPSCLCQPGGLVHPHSVPPSTPGFLT